MNANISRRVFLNKKNIGGTLFCGLALAPVHAGERNEIKVGLIGCGGRGRGAANNTLNADPNSKIYAVADAFMPIAQAAAEGLKDGFEDRVDIGDRIFGGLDAYKSVVDCCDLVLLCESPGFRFRSLAYAVEQGKHVFCEKPVGSDAPTVRSVVESSKIAKEKGLTLVSGLCWRYDLNVKDIMERVCGGEIGDVTSARLNYLGGRAGTRPRLEGDTEMTAQVRNWYNYTWLSGDFNVEQHVHTLDKGLWAMGDVPPATCYGLGARMARIEQPAYGDIYDSMASVFEYPNGTTLYSYCRQQDGCWSENQAYFAGTKGFANVGLWGRGYIADLDGKVVYEQKPVPSDMYTLEHIELYKSIRGDVDTINNGDYMAKATMMGIMSREACYSGKKITWDEAYNSDKSYAPSEYSENGIPWNVPDAQGRMKIQVPGVGQVYHTVSRAD
ncbi:MAG: Gfo/Idh/MocA family oxidoreductase [Thermoguttaceae bacterium]|nr:Gfo/Idh/MocA family oxidoreductase [Thermoguttaceae bacterium]